MDRQRPQQCEAQRHPPTSSKIGLNMIWVMGVVALIGGILNTIQSGSNATLSESLGQPLVAAVVVSLVTTSGFLILALLSGVRVPREVIFSSVPWWAWLGGLMGGFYILGSIFFAEKLGAAVFLGVTVTAGLTTSIVMDHFGLVGFKVHTAGLGRIVGCLLMTGGLAMISFF